MLKWIKIFITFWITSFFYFPIVFYAFPYMNTKTFMAAVGVALGAYTIITRRNATVPKNLLTLSIYAAIVSLMGVLSLTINNTNDDAYSGYIASMAVWISAAYVVCCCIKSTHGVISIRLVSDYVIAVCVMQCISVLLIDNVPIVKEVFDTYVAIDQATLEKIHRLYGFGANLDVAGSRFAASLILIMVIMMKHRDSITDTEMLYYVTAFVFITVVGSMVARTTYVGVGLSTLLFVVTAKFGLTISKRSLRTTSIILSVTTVAIFVCVFKYNSDPNFRYWIRFAFEGFFNMFERGTFAVASTNVLKTMYVFPDNFHTWLIGDGYFSNPYWSDPTYTYIDQNVRGYYMGTDVGYLRFIFYFGVLGLSAFSIFMCKAAQVCIEKCKEYTGLFIFLLIANFTIWFKVATDLFIVFALMICTVNMMENVDDENTHVENECEGI